MLGGFIEQRSWDSPLPPALFGVAAALLAGFVWHERRYGRTREPLVNLKLFEIRSYALGLGVGILYFAGFTATFFTITQYLQIGLDYPAWKAGLATTPFALGARRWPRSAVARCSGEGASSSRSGWGREDVRGLVELEGGGPPVPSVAVGSVLGE